MPSGAECERWPISSGFVPPAGIKLVCLHEARFCRLGTNGVRNTLAQGI
jgi:hypothetical protein